MQKHSITTIRPMLIQSPSNGSLLKYTHTHLISEHNVARHGVSLVSFGQLSQLCLLPTSYSLSALLLRGGGTSRLPGHWARAVQQQGKHWCVLVTNPNSTIWTDVKKINCISIKSSQTQYIWR